MARLVRAVSVAGVISLVGLLGVSHMLVRQITKEQPVVPTNTPAAPTETVAEAKPEPFPLGVDPHAESITERPEVDTYLGEHIDTRSLATRSNRGWFGRILGTLAQSAIYQNFASPTGRILVIQSGERKEEVANNFGKILKWDNDEKAAFTTSITDAEPAISEGKFVPATYITGKDASPEEVAKLVTDRFETDIRSRYTEDIEAVVPLEQTLIIASLLEREAYDFDDMRHISGVIWNRLFADMNLQLDASLQYAKGTKSTTSWWPRVVPADKYIKSPFNTYAHEGLPPAPIANPSLDAILAALNPRKTDCMYYFHDKKGGFYCSVTYEEHVAKLKQIYGRGK